MPRETSRAAELHAGRSGQLILAIVSALLLLSALLLALLYLTGALALEEPGPAESGGHIGHMEDGGGGAGDG